MDQKNSRRNFLRTTAVATVGLSLMGTAGLANSKSSKNFPGYSSISDSKTDFRSGLILDDYLHIKGQLLCEDTLLPVSNAKIEVWFQVEGKPWKIKRGHFYTDAMGNYSFKSDWPGKKESEKRRFYFRVSKNGAEKYGLMCVDEFRAYAHSSHWENHHVLGDKVLPTMKKQTLKHSIELNFSL